MMTYGDFKRKVLELINQYSVAGETISPAYNNQSDYIHKIPGLINDGILRLRTEARPRIATHSFSNGGKIYGNMRMFPLPHGYRGIKTGGVYRITDGQMEPFSGYRFFGEGNILFPCDGAEYIIEYYCDPDYLPADPPGEYEMNEDPEILTAVCYFAAAMLVVDKNEYLYAVLYNEFTRRLTGMVRPPTAELSPIVDVYGV